MCELYADMSSDVSDYSDNDSMDSDSDSDVPTSSRKQLRSAGVTSDAETSATEEESGEPENSNERSDVWCKTDKKPTNEPFLGTTGLNIVIDNPESVVEVVSSVIGEDLILLRTKVKPLPCSKCRKMESLT